MGTRATERSGDVRDDVAQYRSFHDEGDGGDVKARKTDYTTMVTGFYDLVTDFYERGWGKSFHFAPRFEGEPFHASIARHQHFLASRLGLRPGMRVLDVGCGVGGPMRGVARFSGAHVIGVNINAYQVSKARRYNAEAGLAETCELIEADFMELPIEDDSIDAIYGFEATCHAPDKTALFRELERVLKPGGRFAAYEWCLTSSFDPADTEHRRIKKGIEEGDGLPDIWTIDATRACLTDAGFTLIEEEDRASSGDATTPWFLPLTGRERSMTGLRRSPLGRRAVSALITVLEAVGKAPKGTKEVSQFLHDGADALVEGGEAGIFTPMFFFVGEKPA